MGKRNEQTISTKRNQYKMPQVYKNMFTALNQYGSGKGSPVTSKICLNSYNQYK